MRCAEPVFVVVGYSTGVEQGDGGGDAMFFLCFFSLGNPVLGIAQDDGVCVFCFFIIVSRTVVCFAAVCGLGGWRKGEKEVGWTVGGGTRGE